VGFEFNPGRHGNQDIPEWKKRPKPVVELRARDAGF
jgi:hypothetical protein